MDVNDRQGQFDAVYAHVFRAGPKPQPSPRPTPAPAAPSTNGSAQLEDDEVIRLACSSRKSGEKFSALWAGRWNDYFNSASEADSSVTFTLAFYTKDPVQIDRIFRRSGLMRDKWDEQRGEQTYGVMTIDNALANVTKQYQARRTTKAKTKEAASDGVHPPMPPCTGRPQIQGNERQLRDIRSEALNALLLANDPPHLFRRADGIGRVALVQVGDKPATPQIQQLDSVSLRGELTNAADWFRLKHTREGDVYEQDLPPTAIAQDILALPGQQFPPLSAIITCPAFTRDGDLIVKDGYDAASGLWHYRTLTDLADVPDDPTPEEIAAARDTLLDIVADFPFADQASRAHALALMLLPYVRHMIAGPTPCHAVDAPTAGTGKGLLVQACLYASLGFEAPMGTGAREADEWRKRITSELVAGKPVVAFDNAASRLDSEHLASVLTATTWTDRVLGGTRSITVPNLAIWVCIGNNLTFSKELARRVVWVRLDARVESPEQRTGFRHANLIHHCRKHRTLLVHAALTLIRAWLAAGCPAGKAVMGSYESYVAVMGGILDVAGVPGFLTNAGELRQQADTETSEWRAFVHAWWATWNDAWVGVADLATLLWADDGKRSELLGGIVNSPNDRGVVTQLGKRLSKKRDCVIGGFRIITAEKPDRCGRLQYRLVPNDVQTSGPETGSLQEVCTEVCTPNYSNTNELSSGADFRILPPEPLAHVCTRARAGAHAHCETEGIPLEKSAEVCTVPQAASPQALTSADLPANFVQTSAYTYPKSAARSSTDSTIDWYRGPSDGVPEDTLALARAQPRWTPEAWYERLLQLADTCRLTNPNRADQLDHAARLMLRSQEKHDRS